VRSQTARRLRAPTEGGGHDARNDSARSIFITKACLHSVGGGMGLAKPLDAFRTDFDPGFAKKLIGEQASAHAYFAMDAPDRQLDALCIERLLPCKHMLIDAVDERAVEINKKGGSIRMLSLPFWIPGGLHRFAHAFLLNFLQTAAGRDGPIEMLSIWCRQHCRRCHSSRCSCQDEFVVSGSCLATLRSLELRASRAKLALPFARTT
jgi:hypothetical protein